MRKTLYGITEETYQALLAAQDRRCAICRDPLNFDKPKQIHTDHDHATGKVRGILCRFCNHAIGLLRDRIDLTQAATAYLIKYADDSLGSA